MESKNWRRLAAPGRIGNIIIILAFVLVIAVVLLAAFRPDRGINLFERAQRLEAAGQWEQALGHYRLLVETEPDSSFAPRALIQQGTILEGMARRTGKQYYFQQAIDQYQQVSRSYPTSALAGQALLDGAELASVDLQDYEQARQLYQKLLNEYPRNADYTSQATLALGRVALAQKNAPLAQKYFQEVLENFGSYNERCAEAQYQSGVVAETLTNQPEAAKVAYQQTIKNYPTTVWATNAKARLGMLFYGDIAPGGAARRVETRLTPLANTGYADESLYLPLALVLSARGMEVDPSTMKGWTLQPFFCGYDESNPGDVTSLNQQFENAVANAGLSFSVQSGDAEKAFASLREAIDRGQSPVIYLNKWMLVTGYDTVAQIVMLQEQGAEIKKMSLMDLMEVWGKSIPKLHIAGRKPYTFLSFQSKDGVPKTTRQRVDENDQNAVQLFVTPSFDLTLPTLSRKAAQQRTIRRAATLLLRAHSGETLLNVEALSQLAKDVNSLGTLPPSPVPVPESESEEAELAVPVDWQQRIERANKLAPWFGAPLRHWIEARRDAATFLENAGKELKSSEIQQAARELRHSIMALQNASSQFPDGLKSGSTTLWTTLLGRQLQRTAQDLREAAAAEKKAADLMQNNS